MARGQFPGRSVAACLVVLLAASPSWIRAAGLQDLADQLKQKFGQKKTKAPQAASSPASTAEAQAPAPPVTAGPPMTGAPPAASSPAMVLMPRPDIDRSRLPAWVPTGGAAATPIGAKSTPPDTRFVYADGTYLVDRATGALSILPAAKNGFNSRLLSDNPDARRVFDRSRKYLILVDRGFLSVIALEDSGPQLRQTIGLKHNRDAQPVFHPTLDVMYVVMGDYGKPNQFGISAFSFDKGTGQLTQRAGFDAVLGALGRDFSDIAMDDAGGVLFDIVGDSLFGFKVDAQSGALRALTGSPAKTTPNPFLSVHPSGRFVWFSAAPKGVQGFSIDAAGGAMSPIQAATPAAGPDCFARGRLAFDPSGRFAYSLSNTMAQLVCGYEVDSATGTLTALRAGPFKSSVPATNTAGPAFSPNGKFLYAETYDDSSVIATRNYYNIIGYAMDPQSGALREIGRLQQLGASARRPTSFGLGTFNTRRLLFDATGEYLYGPEWSYQADPNTGVLSAYDEDLRVKTIPSILR